MAELVRLPDGAYRATCYSAEYSLTRNGRPMYTAILIVDEGPWENMMIHWKIVETKEYPRLLHQYFRALYALGVDTDTYMGARSHEDIIRAIVQTGSTLDIVLRTESRGWQNVQDFRVVTDQTSRTL